MTMLRKTLLPVIFLCLIVAASLAILNSVKNHKKTTSTSSEENTLNSDVGGILPDLTFDTLQGQTVKLSDLHAKVTLISFWATWCPTCVTELPSIVKLYEKYKNKGFVPVLVNVEENAAAVLPGFAMRYKMTMPLYVDPQAKLGDLFDIHAIPFSVVLDRNNKVIYNEAGARNWFDEEFQKQIEEWLK